MSMSTHATVQCDECKTLFDSDESTTLLTVREQATAAGWQVGDTDLCPTCRPSGALTFSTTSLDASTGCGSLKLSPESVEGLKYWTPPVRQPDPGPQPIDAYPPPSDPPSDWATHYVYGWDGYSYFSALARMIEPPVDGDLVGAVCQQLMYIGSVAHYVVPVSS